MVKGIHFFAIATRRISVCNLTGLTILETIHQSCENASTREHQHDAIFD
jgi:hypothetical protein